MHPSQKPHLRQLLHFSVTAWAFSHIMHSLGLYHSLFAMKVTVLIRLLIISHDILGDILKNRVFTYTDYMSDILEMESDNKDAINTSCMSINGLSVGHIRGYPLLRIRMDGVPMRLVSFLNG